jgi:hypothetical protein
MIGKLCRAVSLVRLQLEHGAQEGVQLIYLRVVHHSREQPLQCIRQRRPFLDIDEEFTWQNISSGRKHARKKKEPSLKNSSLNFPRLIKSNGKSPKTTVMIATCEERSMSVGNKGFPVNIW